MFSFITNSLVVDVQKVSKPFFWNIWLINLIRRNSFQNSCCFVDFRHIYASKRLIVLKKRIFFLDFRVVCKNVTLNASWSVKIGQRVKFTFGKRRKSQNGARVTHKAASSHRRIMKFVFEPHSTAADFALVLHLMFKMCQVWKTITAMEELRPLVSPHPSAPLSECPLTSVSVAPPIWHRVGAR